jgi:hypothetical protein
MMAFEDTPPMEATRAETEEVIQAWRAKRAERLEADKVANKLKDEETEMKSWLINVFQEQKFEGMLINGRITGASSKEVHVVDDRVALIDYILDTRSIDFLQFRISDTAIFAREEEGEVIPGVSLKPVYDLFDRKA